VTPGPALFNACDYLLDRHLREGRGDKLAPNRRGRRHELRRTRRGASHNAARGFARPRPAGRAARGHGHGRTRPSSSWCTWRPMRMGAVPVPISTMLRADGIAEILADSRARVVAVERGVPGGWWPRRWASPGVTEVMAVVADDELAGLTADVPDEIYPTTADSPAFWLYTSGTTGTPKGRDAPARLGPGGVRDLRYPGARDHPAGPAACPRPRLFFAYGLGNSVLFPMSAGAAAVLEPSPAPSRDYGRTGREIRRPRCSSPVLPSSPTCCVPTCRRMPLAGVRLAASAGEALPAALYQRWTSHFGVDILDGIGHDRDAAHLPV